MSPRDGRCSPELGYGLEIRKLIDPVKVAMKVVKGDVSSLEDILGPQKGCVLAEELTVALSP